MNIAYGIHITGRDDPYITITETALQSLIAGNAGAYLGMCYTSKTKQFRWTIHAIVDVFPIRELK